MPSFKSQISCIARGLPTFLETGYTLWVWRPLPTSPAEGLGTKKLYPAVSLTPSHTAPGPGWEMGSEAVTARSLSGNKVTTVNNAQKRPILKVIFLQIYKLQRSLRFEWKILVLNTTDIILKDLSLSSRIHNSRPVFPPGPCQPPRPQAT